MSEPQREFQIKRRRPTGNRFTLDVLRTVDVGIEGQKLVGEIASRRGEHGFYFFKPMWGEKEAYDQRKKYDFLKQNGATVVPLFKPVRLDDGRSYAIIKDLTEGGKYWFYGMNNPEIDSDEFKNTSKKVPQVTLDRITQEMIKSCEAAVTPNNQIYADNRIFEFQNNAFLLFIDPSNPENAVVYTADLGIDVMNRSLKDKDKILENNIDSACTFFSWMFSKRMVLPEKYSHLQARVDKHMDEIINWVDIEKPALLKNAPKNR